MDVKIIAYRTDGGIWGIEIDTNRIVTNYGQPNVSKGFFFGLGLFLNITHIAMTFYYIRLEKKTKLIIQAK